MLASWWARFSKGKFHSVWKRQQRVWASVDRDWKHLTQQGWSLPSGVRSGLGEIKHLACIFAWRTILRTPLNTCPLAVNGPKCGPLWSDNSKAIKTLTRAWKYRLLQPRDPLHPNWAPYHLNWLSFCARYLIKAYLFCLSKRTDGR